MTKRQRYYKPSFECLESRWTPAGNVTAVYALSNLGLVGNALANAISITQNADGTITVTGVNGATINNNNQASFTTTGAVVNLNVQLGAGNDSTTFDLTGQGITILGNATFVSPDADRIDTTTNFGVNNFLTIGTVGNAATGNLSITNGTGNAFTQLTNLRTTGSVGISNGVGYNDTFLGTGGEGFVNDIGKNLTITNGAQPATNPNFRGTFTEVSGTNVGTLGAGNLTITNGAVSPAGGEGFTNLIFPGFNGGANPLVRGNVSVTNTSGNVLNILGSVDVTGSVGFANQNASAQTIVDGIGGQGAPVITGNLSITGTGRNFIQIGAGEGGTGINLGGNLTVNVPALLPTFITPGSANVFINNSTIGGTTSLTLTGNGANRLDVLNSTFNGAFGFAATGSGPSTVNIQTQAPGGTNTTTFNSTVKFSLGTGNDTVNVANTGAAPVAGAVVNFNNPLTYPSQFFLGNQGVNTRNVGGAGATVFFANPNIFFNFV